MPDFKEVDPSHYWSFVDNAGSDECWHWTGVRDKDGYGRYSCYGFCFVASRLAWELTHGEALGSRMACHHCDTPSCCNPTHLFAAAGRDNSRDALAKGRLRPGRSPGSANPNAKLCENDIDQIRMMFALGMPNTEIAMYMNIHHSMIGKIRTRKSWAHYQGPVI